MVDCLQVYYWKIYRHIKTDMHSSLINPELLHKMWNSNDETLRMLAFGEGGTSNLTTKGLMVSKI